MGSGAGCQMTNIPPPPPGFVLKKKAGDTPAPPPGFVPKGPPDVVQMSVDKTAADGEMGVTEDVLRSGATGLGEGVTGTVGFLGDIERGMDYAGDWVARQIWGDEEAARRAAALEQAGHGRQQILPTTADIESATGFDEIKHKPQTVAGEYARTAGQFIPAAAVLGPGGAVKNAVKFGVVPAVVSESAGQGARAVAPEAEPYARLLGALGGGLGVAILTKPGTAQSVLAGKLPKGITPNDIDAAGRLIQTGERMGVKLTWPEALKKATDGRVDLTGLQRVVEQSQGGQQVMAPYMAARPGQVAQAGVGAMDDLTRGVQMTDPVRAGLTVQRVSKDTLDKLRQRINDTTRKLYQAADIDMVDDTAFNAISRDPVFQDALAAVRELPEYSRFIAGLPDRSVGVFNEVKKYLDDIAGFRAASGKNQASSVYGGVAREVRDAAKASSPDYSKALSRQETLRRNVLDPAEAGPLGAMSETDDILQQGRRLFPVSPAENSEKVVAQTVRRLVLKDPKAAFQLVRTNLKQVFDEATQANMGGANEWGGAKFASTIRGNAQQAKNLEAAIKALPDGNTRWDAFNNFLTVMETTGSRLPANSATAFNQAIQTALKETGTAAKIATGTRTFGKSVLEKWEEFKLGKNAETLAEIFTDPSSRTRMLLKGLAAGKTPARKAQVAALLVYYATNEGKKASAPVGQ